jgi:spermidine synthase
MTDRKPRLLELPSPFAREPGTLRLIEPAEGFGVDQFDRLREGTLGQPFMIDDGAMRHLFFNTASIQSSMRLDDPHGLVTAYTRKMMAFLLFKPEPRHVLMIGLGGGSLAKFCYRHLPRTRISVVEISAGIIALREQFSIPADDERFEIIHDDGAAFLAREPVRPDVILIDAFDEIGVAESLASGEFYSLACQSLTSDGLLVMNLAGDETRYMAHLESIDTVFAGVVSRVPVADDSNVLLFAFKWPPWAGLADTLHNRAAELERELGLEFSRFLEQVHAGSKTPSAKGFR